LADVAQVQTAHDANLTTTETFLEKLANPRLFEACKCGTELWRQSVFVYNANQDGLRQVAHDVGAQNPESRECSREHGNEHRLHFESSRQIAGMQRTGATESNQRIVARIVALFDGDDANGALHDSVGNAEDAGGEGFSGTEAAAML